MSQIPPPVTDDEPVELSESDRHLLLSVERRRVTLDVLTSGSTPIFLDDLAMAVAEREANDSVASEESVERVAVSLHQNHLPKMAEFDVIGYDPDEQLVIRNPASNRSDGGPRWQNSTRAQGDTHLAELSDSDFHRLFSHERRRAALEVLSELTPPVELEELATQIAERESGGVTSNDEKVASVASALHHAHLPKLDEIGVIEYDPKEARVERCPPAALTTHGYPAD